MTLLTEHFDTGCLSHSTQNTRTAEQIKRAQLIKIAQVLTIDWVSELLTNTVQYWQYRITIFIFFIYFFFIYIFIWKRFSVFKFFSEMKYEKYHTTANGLWWGNLWSGTGLDCTSCLVVEIVRRRLIVIILAA